MIAVWLLVIILACIWIMKSCDPFEDASNYLGRNMGPGIKGATINAIGSSMPELWTAFIFLFFYKDEAGFASGVATTAGSAMFNAIIIPSLVIISAFFTIRSMTGIKVDKRIIIRDGIFFIAAELALILLLKQGVLSNWMGLILIGIYCAYAITLYVHNKISGSEENEEYENEHEFTTITAWRALILSTLSIGLGCFAMTHAVVNVATIMGIHPFFIAVILAAAATSVPDTILSMKDASKGNFDDAISNAIGSNIFDICICLGLPLFIYTTIFGTDIQIHVGVTELRILLLLFTGIVLILFLSLKKLGLKTAGFLIGMYLVYVTNTICRAYDVNWAVQIGNKLTGIQ